jgi:hypothetical protein
VSDIVILTYGIEPDAPEVEGKFLQLALHGREHLVFAPRAMHSFHNQILAHFLEDRGIPHHWSDEHTLEVDPFDLRIIGGGKFHLDTKRKTLVLSDNSQAYGRFDERGLRARLRATRHAWRSYEITIS